MKHAYRAPRGLNEKLVTELSAHKTEPTWMLERRLHALNLFKQMPLPRWGPDLTALDMTNLHYYLQAVPHQHDSWHTLPEKIRQTFDQLGIPEAERSFLAGTGAQYESEMVYKQLRDRWQKQGVIFLSPEEGLSEHAALFKQHFGSVVPIDDNKFAALNSAVWSGGTFLYIPKGVRVEEPIQTYFRMDSPNMGQFERTLIIADEGSFVHYVEGCSAPVYRTGSLHSAVVELIALPGSRIRYTTIQNWSDNVYNLVTKRAIAHEQATVEWIDGNFGSAVTMKYPTTHLRGKGASGTLISVNVADEKQILDSGGSMIHHAPHTRSNIISKSLCRNGGRSHARTNLVIMPGAHDSHCASQCDSLLLNKGSRADAHPRIDVREPRSEVSHEASVGTLSPEHLFYLQSRGFTQQEARALILNGFVEPFVSQLPMEYAVEINRLIAMELP